MRADPTLDGPARQAFVELDLVDPVVPRSIGRPRLPGPEPVHGAQATGAQTVTAQRGQKTASVKVIHKHSPAVFPHYFDRPAPSLFQPLARLDPLSFPVVVPRDNCW